MTEEQLGRLFQAFAQAEASTTRRFGGTGLGLALVRHFCQMMGGDVTVASAPGAGSTFTVRLPARRRAPRVRGAERPTRRVGHAAHPGLDGTARSCWSSTTTPASRDLLRPAPRGRGLRASSTAAGGEEGLRLARELRPAARSRSTC